MLKCVPPDVDASRVLSAEWYQTLSMAWRVPDCFTVFVEDKMAKVLSSVRGYGGKKLYRTICCGEAVLGLTI